MGKGSLERPGLGCLVLEMEEGEMSGGLFLSPLTVLTLAGGLERLERFPGRRLLGCPFPGPWARDSMLFLGLLFGLCLLVVPGCHLSNIQSDVCGRQKENPGNSRPCFPSLQVPSWFAFFFTSFRALLVLSRGFGTGKCAYRVFLPEVSLDFFHLLLPNIINLWYKH